MGFDMYIENPPEGEDDKVEAARQDLYAAALERDAHPHGNPEWEAAQSKVHQALATLGEAHTAYFRLNIWDMGTYCSVMDELGMLANSEGWPGWPDLPNGVTWEDVEAIEDPEDSGARQSAKPAAIAFYEQHQAALSWHPDPAHGIEAFKFTSNDGWLITPAEITATLATYRSLAAEHVKEVLAKVGNTDDLTHWATWIAYLDRAQRGGGFRVH